MRGLIYWNTFLYRSAMEAIYGSDFIRRYELIASEIKQGWSVLDLCCGDCYITRFLGRTIRYEGRDFNKTFIREAKKKGINVSFCDVKKNLEEKERFDCVIMMGGLHQFIPDEDDILRRMKRIAKRRVVICEPCKNIVSSKNMFVSFLAKVVSNPGVGHISDIKRFTYSEIIDFFKRNGAKNIIDAGKDLIGVFEV